MRRYLWMTLFAVGAHLSIQSSPVLAQTVAEEMRESAVVGNKAVAATVNINTASAGDLASKLNGIGGSKAQAIVRYREQFGPFESVDELSEVAGIGASTVERNRSLLSTK
ncbi:ComEA family DNA-binding protein [Congregibacter variabilis]|uniref:ComEA family DNA-binding protein n=1 Tax=Congregibacter variabilis TaxID=3081200 RepID=A0ABZ0I8G9_9GAMM|nr:ComEA family DNA-binding protein [Congregibacter sp. IMCC43200]